MLRGTLTIGLFLAVTMAAQDKPSPFSKAQTKKNDKTVSLTGCLDQRGEKFVLAAGADLTPIAELRGDTVPEESFPKHLGHRVTVRGVVVSGGDTPVIRVRSIRTVAETCGSPSA